VDCHLLFCQFLEDVKLWETEEDRVGEPKVFKVQGTLEKEMCPEEKEHLQVDVLKREGILDRKMCPKEQGTMIVIVLKCSGDIDFNVL